MLRVVKAAENICVSCVYDEVNDKHIKQRDNENRTLVHISTLGRRHAVTCSNTTRVIRRNGVVCSTRYQVRILRKQARHNCLYCGVHLRQSPPELISGVLVSPAVVQRHGKALT